MRRVKRIALSQTDILRVYKHITCLQYRSCVAVRVASIQDSAYPCMLSKRAFLLVSPYIHSTLTHFASNVALG